VHHEVFDALGAALKRKTPFLTAYHPFGRTASSIWFNDAPWLDINMFQSGHRRYDQASLGAWDDNKETAETFFGEDNWRYVRRDYGIDRKPRPVLDAEPSYEGIPQGLHDPAQPFWTDADARRYEWWSVLEGAAGHTYGHNAIQQAYTGGEKAGAYGCTTPWNEAIHAPGSGEMHYLKDLMLSLDWQNGKAAPDMIADNAGDKRYYRISCFASDTFILCYSYMGNPFTIHLPGLGTRWALSYFDSERGIKSFCGYAAGGKDYRAEFPKKPVGQNDWGLIFINL
jgi:hypothetical protein